MKRRYIRAGLVVVATLFVVVWLLMPMLGINLTDDENGNRHSTGAPSPTATETCVVKGDNTSVICVPIGAPTR